MITHKLDMFAKEMGEYKRAGLSPTGMIYELTEDEVHVVEGKYNIL